MYQCTDDTKKILQGFSPHYQSTLIFPSFNLTDDNIYSVNTQHASVSGENLIQGAIISQTLTAEVELTNNKIQGKNFDWELTIVETEEEIPMGHFTVDSCTKVNNHYQIQASDKLSKSDKIYVPKIRLPAWSDDITDDICSQLGINYIKPDSQYFDESDNNAVKTAYNQRVKVTGFNYWIESIPDKTTMRQMLSYIAGMQGAFGIINRQGEFEYKHYSKVDEDIFTDKTDELEINESTVNTAEMISNLDNPYLTEILREQIRRCWVKDYVPHTINMRLGNPCIDVWDIYNIDGKSIPVMQLERKYDGGFTTTIRATVSTKEEY